MSLQRSVVVLVLELELVLVLDLCPLLAKGGLHWKKPVNEATAPLHSPSHLKASKDEDEFDKKESILANEGIACIEALDQSGQHRSEQPIKHGCYSG